MGDVEQLLVYQEQQSRLRNRTLLDLPEALQLMQKYKKKDKKKRKSKKTFTASVDESVPLKIHFKRQRKPKTRFNIQRTSSESFLKFKLLREASEAESEQKSTHQSKTHETKSADVELTKIQSEVAKS